MKKAFTLIELLIVICILGIFSVVLFRTYNTISRISFRVEQQKKANEELLFLSEILQNFANRNSIDFDKYGNSLAATNGFTGTLCLSGDDGRFSIYSSGDCVEFSEEPDFSNLQSGCALFLLKEGGSPVKITSDSVYFSKAKFKIIPYYDSNSVNSISACIDNNNNYFGCVNDDGFWLFVDVYSKLYNNEIWANDIHLLVQHFFNI